MAYVTVDVDLDDIDTDELVEELEKRLERKRTPESEKQMILDLGNNSNLFFKVETLDDKMKIEHLQKVFNKYSSKDFEALLPE